MHCAAEGTGVKVRRGPGDGELIVAYSTETIRQAWSAGVKPVIVGLFDGLVTFASVD